MLLHITYLMNITLILLVLGEGHSYIDGAADFRSVAVPFPSLLCQQDS